MTATARTLAGAFTSRRADLFGIGWVLLFALLFLSPALKDGPQFAPADLGAGNSPITAGALALSHDCLPAPGQATPPTSCPHNGIDGDEITQAIPWNTTNYQLVHAGEFPWWNDLEGNGLPQFLNFESGTLALPSLVGYLVPLPESFLVTVLMKLLIAGIGSYLLCRLLACRPLAAAFGGVSFMLSGAFAGWLGWSISGTLCWVGAIAAAALWSYRRARRALPVTLLAGAVAFSLYGGFVEAYLLLAGFFCLVALAGALAMALNRRPIAARGLGRVAGGVLAGTALAAPLWLTGASLLRASVRSGEVSAHGIAVKGVALAFAQGYYGLPLAGSTFFGTGLPNYYESAAYVGVLALVLVGVALICAWRRPAVVAFAAAAVGSLLVAYRLGPVSPVQRLVIDLGLGAVDVDRVLPLVGFAIAILSALGLELLVARHAEAVLRRALAASLLVVAIALAALGVSALVGLRAPYAALRQASLYWPVATLLVFAAAALLLLNTGAPARLRALPAGGILGALALVGQSAFLLFAGVGINSYAAAAYPQTAATMRLTRLVGSSLVALDSLRSAGCYRLPPEGFYPNENVGYGVDELAVHDPTTPKAYFDSWPLPAVGQTSGGGCAVYGAAAGVNLFAPAVHTAALARTYGARFVLAASADPPPKGMKRLTQIGPDTLYAVPGAARFTAGTGTVVSSAHPDDARYRVTVRSARPTRLVARVTDAPGWQASAGGRRLPISRALGAFLSVAVPAGTTTVTFSYRPPHLALALSLALLAAVSLLVLALVDRRSRRRAAAG